MIEKPTLTNIQERANKLYEYLKTQDDYVTKEQIGAYLGVDNERSVREVISLLATKKPILSKSNSKGYKLAKSVKDVDDAINVWLELDSRMEELNKRRTPIINFVERMNKTTRRVPNDNESNA
jgi:hypothetical protein